MSDYLRLLIEDYERDLKGNTYTFLFSNGEEISFEIRKRNVPHLLGIGRLPLRQVRGKFAGQLGIGKDEAGGWYPESLLVLRRNVTAYIDDQLPLDIVDFRITS